MTATDPMSAEPGQFSIRLPRPFWPGVATVVLIVVGAGLHVGIPMYNQQVAIREIESLGGRFTAAPRGPVWLRERISLIDVVICVDLNDTLACDADLVHLKKLPSLQLLSLDRTQISDGGLIHLKDMTNLQQLSLNETKITDAGLFQLRRLKVLVSLNLGRTMVTDAGLIYIQGLTNLHDLDLGATEVTDAGLQHLKCLTGLRRVVLRSVFASRRVTRTGIAELKRAMPLLRVSSG